MASHTVKSPYGAIIEIVDDDDWALTAGVNARSLRMWDASKPVIVRELWEHGPATDESGRATQVLYDRMMAHYPHANDALGWPKSIAVLMNQPVNSAAFKRDVNGKRTYGIELAAMPEIWYRKLQTDIGGTVPTFAAVPIDNGDRGPEFVTGGQPTDAELDAIYADNRATLEAFNRGETIPLEETSPVIEVEVASQVAMELLTKVVEIIAAGSSVDASSELKRLRNELVHSQGLLSQRLDENDRLRRQVREAGDELHAVKLERDGLRQRLRQTEANLSSALKGESAAAVTTEVMKRVDRIMRESPKPHERGDE